MKKTDITDIRRLAGLQPLNENYIYAAEEEEESTEETEEAIEEIDGDEEGMAAESEDGDDEEKIDEFFNYDSPKKGGQGNPSKDNLALRGGKNTPVSDPASYKDMVKGTGKHGKFAKDLYGINGPKGQLPEDEEDLEEAKSKKAKKDYDGDGKIESEKDEVWGSRMAAAKKAGNKVDEDIAWIMDKVNKLSK